MLGKIERRRRRTKDEMIGWYHRLNGHEFEQSLGDSDGQGSPACCRQWGRKESDTTERLNNNGLGSRSQNRASEFRLSPIPLVMSRAGGVTKTSQDRPPPHPISSACFLFVEKL